MNTLTPPPDLHARIMNQIHYQQRLQELKRKLLLYGAGLIGSTIALMVVSQEFVVQAHQTGFIEFGSLALSDFRMLTGHLSDYALSLAESLPAISFAFVCLALLAGIISLVKMLGSASELKHFKITHT